jgi:pantoate--beta-alanine ligase
MGFLHEGHLSLVRKATEENDIVVVSIFVNPTQFGPEEDYEQYPRDLSKDKVEVEELGVDYIFAPEASEMYPEGYHTFVEVEELTDYLCGNSRPGFFRGVATVVCKLFNIVQPDRAYFGQKDFQQFVIIKRMVRDLNFSIELRMLPIVREEDGVALSSRNKYLNSEERKAATVLYKSLSRGKDLILKGGKDARKIRDIMVEIINEEELAQIDYVEVVDPDDLVPVEEVGEKVLLAMAVYIGETRLIDNMYIEEK